VIVILKVPSIVKPVFFGFTLQAGCDAFSVLGFVRAQNREFLTLFFYMHSFFFHPLSPTPIGQPFKVFLLVFFFSCLHASRLHLKGESRSLPVIQNLSCALFVALFFPISISASSCIRFASSPPPTLLGAFSFPVFFMLRFADVFFRPSPLHVLQ